MADIPPGSAYPPPSPTAHPTPPVGGSGPGLPGRRTWKGYLVLAGLILLVAGCAVYMAVKLGENLGAQAFAIGLVAALLPVPVLVSCFLWLDRYEPEPLKYLIFCFAWGAFVSTAASLKVNQAGADLFGSLGWPDALVAVLVAPFIEETTKALGPVLLFAFRRREWSGITDGIVYCGLSAVGFAMVENILYLGGHAYAAGAEQYGPATGAQQVIVLFIMRILLFGFAHPLFTSMTGVGLGIAARSGERRVRILAPLAGWLVAMMLHGTWNLLPSLAQAVGQPVLALCGYLGVMGPIFFGMVGLAVWLRAWEGRLTVRVLPDYVRAGWLTPPEVASLASLGRRHAARSWARRVAGNPGLQAMRSFQYAATRLALLRDGMRRGLDRRPAERERTLREERQLLAALGEYRNWFVGRDPQVPVGTWDGRRYHLTFPDGRRRPVEPSDEPVVPIPVVLAPAAVAPAYGAAPAAPGGYGGPAAPPWGAPPRAPGPWGPAR